MGPTLVRVGLLVLALAVGAWLVLSFRVVELEADGEAVLDRARRGSLPARELERAREVLQDEADLSADTRPLLTEAQLLLAAGRGEEAEAIVRRVTEQEPENVDAWSVLFYLAAEPQASREAKRAVRRLNPWAGGQLRRP